MVDTLGYAGMDFCIIDTEHGPIDMQTSMDLVIAADGAGVSPIIRVGDNDERLILRALDIGSAGVQVPQINSVDDARRVIHSAKVRPYRRTRPVHFHAGQATTLSTPVNGTPTARTKRRRWWSTSRAAGVWKTWTKS